MEVYKMKTELLRGLFAHAQGEIAKHKANIEVYLNNPAGIGEHSDIIDFVQRRIKEALPVVGLEYHLVEQRDTNIEHHGGLQDED